MQRHEERQAQALIEALAEAYYRSKPFGSWAMVLVGDPLYNPFKKNPALDEDALPERMRGTKSAASPSRGEGVTG